MPSVNIREGSRFFIFLFIHLPIMKTYEKDEKVCTWVLSDLSV